MNILVNCNELINPDFVMLEAAVGAEGCWAYHKLRLFLKEQRTDKVYRGKLKYVAAVLRVPLTILEPMLDQLPTTLAAHGGQYWQLHEITKELSTLEGRLKGALKGTLNKGKGMGKDVLINSIKEELPKKKLPTKSSTLVFPEWVMADSEVVELLTDWINYRAAKNKKVTQIALKLNLKPYLNDTKRLKSALEATIAKGWQGIYEDKSYSPVKGNYGAPTATLNPDGTVSGEIDFNKLPANAKVGIMNQNVLKHFEEKERLENLNKKLEIANDNRSTDGKTLDRILRAVPQLGTKVRHGN